MNLLRAIRLFFSLVFREVEPKGTMEERYRIKGRIWPPLAWDVAYGYYRNQKETTIVIQEMRDYYLAGGQEYSNDDML
jgi:hypothetical protein